MVWLIIIDSNVWIFAETTGTPEHYFAVNKLQRHLRDRVGINLVIFSEVFHKLSVLFNSTTSHKRVDTIIHHPSIEWLDINREQAEHAMELAKKKSLRINDALIAQQALELDIPILTDNVKDFKKVNNLRVVSLR